MKDDESSIRTSAERVLKERCPYAYLTDGAKLLEEEAGRFYVNSSEICCGIIGPQESQYGTDGSGKQDTTGDYRCEYPRKMSNCLLKQVWRLSEP